MKGLNGFSGNVTPPKIIPEVEDQKVETSVIRTI